MTNMKHDLDVTLIMIKLDFSDIDQNFLIFFSSILLNQVGTGNSLVPSKNVYYPLSDIGSCISFLD